MENKIRKIVFINKKDEKTKRVILGDIVVFREKTAPLIVSYSRKICTILFNELGIDNSERNVIDRLKNEGLIEIISSDNEKEAERIGEEIRKERDLYGVDSIVDFDDLEKNILGIDGDEFEILPIGDFQKLKKFLMLQSLREKTEDTNDDFEELCKIIDSCEGTALGEIIKKIDYAFGKYLEADLEEKDSLLNEYIDLRDAALKLLEEFLKDEKVNIDFYLSKKENEDSKSSDESLLSMKRRARYNSRMDKLIDRLRDELLSTEWTPGTMIEADLRAREEDKEKLIATISSLQEKNKELERQIAEYEKEIANYSKTEEELKKKLSENVEQRDILKKQYDELQKSVKLEKQKNDEELAEKSGLVKMFEEELARITREKEELEKSKDEEALRIIEEEEKRHKVELAKVEKDLETIKRRNALLEEKIKDLNNSMASSEKYEKAVKGVLEKHAKETEDLQRQIAELTKKVDENNKHCVNILNALIDAETHEKPEEVHKSEEEVAKMDEVRAKLLRRLMERPDVKEDSKAGSGPEKGTPAPVEKTKSGLPKELDELKRYLEIACNREYYLTLSDEEEKELVELLASPNEKIKAIEEAYGKLFITEHQILTHPSTDEKEAALRRNDLNLKINDYVDKRDKSLEEVNEALRKLGLEEVVIPELRYTSTKTEETEKASDTVINKENEKIKNLREYIDLNKKRVREGLSEEEDHRIIELLLTGDKDIATLEKYYDYCNKGKMKREVYDSIVRYFESRLEEVEERNKTSAAPVLAPVGETVMPTEEKKSRLSKELTELKYYLVLAWSREHGGLTVEGAKELKELVASSNEKIKAIELAYQRLNVATELEPTKTDLIARLNNEYVNIRDRALEEVNDAQKSIGETITDLPFAIKPMRVRDSKTDEIEKKLTKKKALREYIELSKKRAKEGLSKEEEQRIRELISTGNEDIDILENIYNEHLDSAVYDSILRDFENSVDKAEESTMTEEIPVPVPAPSAPVKSERMGDLLETILPKLEDANISYKDAVQLLKAYSVFDENKINAEYGDRLLKAISRLVNTPHEGEVIGSIATGFVPDKETILRARDSLTSLVYKIKDGEILSDEEKSQLLDDVYLIAGIQRKGFSDEEVVSRRDGYTLRNPGRRDVKVDTTEREKREDRSDTRVIEDKKDSRMTSSASETVDTEKKSVEKKIEKKEEKDDSTTIKTSKGTFTFKSCLGWLLAGVLAITGIGYVLDIIKRIFSKDSKPIKSVKDNVEHVQTDTYNQSNSSNHTSIVPDKTVAHDSATVPITDKGLLEDINNSPVVPGQPRTRKNVLSLIDTYNYNLETMHFLKDNDNVVNLLKQFTSDAQFKNVCDAIAFGYQMNTLMRIDNNFSLPTDKAKLQSFTNDFLCAKAVINGYGPEQMLTLFGKTNMTYDELMRGYSNFLSMMTLYNTTAVKKPPLELLIDNSRDLSIINSLYDALIEVNKSRKDGVVTSAETDKFVSRAFKYYSSDSFSNEGVKTFGTSLIDGYACMIANRGGLFVYENNANAKAGTHIVGGNGGLSFVKPNGETVIVDKITNNNVLPKVQSAQAAIRSSLDTYNTLARNSNLPLYSETVSDIDYKILGNKKECSVSYLFDPLFNNRKNMINNYGYEIGSNKKPASNTHSGQSVSPQPTVGSPQTNRTTAQQIVDAYRRGEITEQQASNELVSRGIKPDPNLFSRLDEANTPLIGGNDQEINPDRRMSDETPIIGYDSELDTTRGNPDETPFRTSAFRGTLNGMTGAELLGGPQKTLRYGGKKA